MHADLNFKLVRVSYFRLDCPRHTTLREQLFFSLLDIPETISLNLLIFVSVNLNDEENKAVFKSVQTFIIKSKRFRRKVVVLESYDADNLIRHEIQFQLFHRYNLAIQQGF
jgi:hypothetical protein